MLKKANFSDAIYDTAVFKKSSISNCKNHYEYNVKINHRGLNVAISCCTAYAFCYMMRNILSALMPTILESGYFGEKELGSFGSLMLAFYACGQLINGFLGDRIKAKYMISIGLFSSGLCSILFCLSALKSFAAVFWSIIGLSLSMLWGPISRVIVENSDEKRASLHLTIASTGSYVGMLAAYVLAIFATQCGMWKEYLTIGGSAVCIAAVILFIFFSYLEKNSDKHPTESSEKAHTGFSFSDLKPVIFVKPFIIMLFVVMLNGVIRNAVAYWIPTYFCDNLQLDTKVASAISAIIPIIGIFAGYMVLSLCRVVKGDIMALVVLFAVSAFSFLIAIIGRNTIILPIFGMLISNAAMGSANNVIMNTYCLRFRDTGHVSGVSGLLDSACYASSAIANIVFTFTIANTGWNVTVTIWLLVSIFGVVMSYTAWRAYKKAEQ